MNQRKNAMWSINNGVAGDALKHTGNSCGRFLAKKTTSMVFPDLTFSKGLRYRSFCWKTDKVGAQQVFGCYIIDGPQEMSYKMKKKKRCKTTTLEACSLTLYLRTTSAWFFRLLK